MAQKVILLVLMLMLSGALSACAAPKRNSSNFLQERCDLEPAVLWQFDPGRRGIPLLIGDK